MVSAAVREGARLFNEGKYHEAHDAWEEHWGLGDPAERRLLLGLVKAAVALHHLRNGNVRGFDRQLELALPHLLECARHFPDWDLTAFAEAMESLRAAVRFHGDVEKALGSDGWPRVPTPP